VAGLRFDVRETHSRRRIRDADEDFARRTLDLPGGELRLALQGLVAVGAGEFEFVGWHTQPHQRNHRPKSMPKSFSILFGAKLRLV
jgi:hypothetical protein